MNKIIFTRLVALWVALTSITAFAGAISYRQGSQELEGYLAPVPTGSKKSQKKPAILIVHDWMGLSDFQKKKADELSKQGMIAFAVDIYGKGVRPKDAKQAGEFATKFKDDRALLRARVKAAYDKLLAMPEVDSTKVFVIGYCFGGTTALELARTGVKLAGTVSFHGGLSNPNPKDAKKIRGDVLILHGADDPYVPATEVEAFKKEMNDAHKKFTFIAYPGAVHAFTNPEAGSDNSKGAAYNAKADQESWKEFEGFLAGRI